MVTGWTPHWKFARWDLKFLDDPKKVYGEAETINTIVRQGLKEDMPEVYAVCDAFKWDSSNKSDPPWQWLKKWETTKRLHASGCKKTRNW